MGVEKSDSEIGFGGKRYVARCSKIVYRSTSSGRLQQCEVDTGFSRVRDRVARADRDEYV